LPVFPLNNDLVFPSVEYAEEDGLLAFGGDLTEERLILAYRKGIFPWFEDELPLWYSPDPRFVLFPNELQISNSMNQVIRQKKFSFTNNKAFKAVIHNCSEIKRSGQRGTWITDEMKAAYLNLHHLGYAHSAEAWQNGELVGGLYGVRIGKVFCGESMFSKQNNASKYAFIEYIQLLATEGVKLIDCQVYTRHLASMGAKMIPRASYLEYLV
jgi:leucyl/phenylalanyl-tRNA---protein transferase